MRSRSFNQGLSNTFSTAAAVHYHLSPFLLRFTTGNMESGLGDAMMKSTGVLCLAMIMFLHGCATTPIPTEQATPVPASRIINKTYFDKKEATGEVIVKRDDGIGGSACSSRVFVDAIAIADLRPAEKIMLFLPEGDYTIGAEPNGICGGGLSEARAVVKIGKRLVYRIGYGSNGDYHLLPTAF